MSEEKICGIKGGLQLFHASSNIQRSLKIYLKIYCCTVINIAKKRGTHITLIYSVRIIKIATNDILYKFKHFQAAL